jgi:translation initiation factor IF-1
MINTQIIGGGTVVDFLPEACFEVRLDTGVNISASISLELRYHAAPISPGKRVTVRMSPFDMKNGQITACFEKQSENVIST